MDRPRFLELLDAYQDRRLSSEDLAEFDLLLRSSGEARHLFWDQTYQQVLLGEVFAEARGKRLAQEEFALLDANAPSGRIRDSWRPLVLAALLLLGVGLSWLVNHGTNPAGIGESAEAKLGELRGEVVVSDVASSRRAQSGDTVRAGEEIRTGEGGFAVVTYPDRSRLELTSDTAVRLLQDEVAEPSGKRIFLVEGVVNATVTPHPRGRPMRLSTLEADLVAHGTRFSSASVLGETRIEMEAGKALLSRKGDARAIEIDRGTYAVAASDLEVFRTAPLLPASRNPLALFEESAGPVSSLAEVGRGGTLAVACWNGLVKLYDVKSRQVRAVLDAGRSRALALAATGDGRSLAVGYESLPKGKEPAENVVVWDVRRNQIARILSGPRRALALAFTPDCRTLTFTAPRDARSIWVWDLPDIRRPGTDAGRERLLLGDRNTKVRSMALSPDGRTIAAGCLDGRVRLFDIETGRPGTVLEGHDRDVQALAFQPGGDLLASGSRDGTVRLWSSGTGEELRRLTGKFNEVRCLTFSPDGQTLVSGHAGTATLWNVSTGQPRTTLRAHKFAITAVVYLDNGRMLATAGWDRSVKLWRLQPVPGQAL